MVDIRERLHHAPERIPDQAERDDAQQDLAERLGKKGRERALCIGRLSALSERSENGEASDDEIDQAARRIAAARQQRELSVRPGHALLRVVPQKQRRPMRERSPRSAIRSPVIGRESMQSSRRLLNFDAAPRQEQSHTVTDATANRN
jgi:hypothetical protein